jgi:hypothetical protein
VSGHDLFFSGEVGFGVEQEIVENLAELPACIAS